MAARWRPARHCTSQAHTRVAASATRKATSEKLGSNPGASLATLAAGLAGNPVCIAIQITHTKMAIPVKNSRVNQSISAATLRLSVGRANAASVASAGRPSSRARSWGTVNRVAAMATVANHRGRARWRRMVRLANWCRQRHTVHSASGHAGQVNQSSKRPRLCHSLPPSPGNIKRQRHRSSCHASMAASAEVSSMAAAQINPRRRATASSWGSNIHSHAPPRPNNTAKAGAPLNTRPAMPATSPSPGPSQR